MTEKPKPKPEDDRRAAALRENLRKRKMQAEQRREADSHGKKEGK